MGGKASILPSEQLLTCCICMILDCIGNNAVLGVSPKAQQWV
jgi:hypothetical protein